ncbi:hypothetical protein NT2_13_00160 [Caenibius tardaugens NBRC 16725]|uniref:HEAT repeat domain-containing protein n=1 Tax=Caenibius tardaugens NBRC 16725 TaxID=1219035 RepID=U2YPS8_9SPHN|nr:hypothetical protein [Caenibius tardaugens]AZI37933.1 hypothetical protein EGO55_19820 [Caenibius tardaugens NBRC 16725]GAD50930.1 hypothetical protein NT2_13_00160 [Caenibius tardaugens NBRC 16725]
MDDRSSNGKWAPGKTAWEIEQERHQDPEWLAMRAEQEQRRQELETASRAQQELLVADIRRAGYPVEYSVYELVHTADSYPDVIPVLVKHLSLPYSDRIKEGIARALTVVEARGVAGPAIIEALRMAEGDRFYRWALANALTKVATRNEKNAIEELFEIEADDDVRERLKRALKTAAKA